mgnify:CR=1 FL=1
MASESADVVAKMSEYKVTKEAGISLFTEDRE